MRWPRGRQQQPTGKPDKDQQLREALSPYAAGLTDDPSKNWDQYLQEELGIGADGEPAPASPPAAVPPPRPAPESSQIGTLNLVAQPFPGSERARGHGLGRHRGRDSRGSQMRASEASHITITNSAIGPGAQVVVRDMHGCTREDALCSDPEAG